MGVEFTKDYFFETENRPTVNGLVSQAIQNAIKASCAEDNGILRTGRTRHKRAGLCTIGVLFRKKDFREKSSHRRLNLGSKQVITEIAPGEKPPFFTQGRVIAGSKVPAFVFEAAQTTFIHVKNTGVFEQNCQEGVEKYVTSFVSEVQKKLLNKAPLSPILNVKSG